MRVSDGATGCHNPNTMQLHQVLMRSVKNEILPSVK